MAEAMDVRIPSGETVSAKVIKDGLWTAYEAARVLVGPSNRGVRVVNLEMTGKLLWGWLTHGVSKRELESLRGQITYEGWNLINKPLGIDPILLGDEGEFATQLSERMTRVPYHEVTFKGAMAELKKMSEVGPVRIWTVGDVRGIPNYTEPGGDPNKELSSLRGHNEQIKKSARLGFNRMRRSEENRGKDKVFMSEKGVGKVVRHFDVSASEDKFFALNGVIEQFKLLGVDEVVVVDDKLTNTRKAAQIINGIDPNIRVIEVWDRESESFENADREQKTAPELKEELAIVIYSGKDIVERVRPILTKGKKVGWIVDMDDVLINDNKDAVLQTNALLRLLREKRVIEAEF